MSESKLFSIIIPCYNAEKYLDYCINSVLAQNVNCFEIVLIDDGSTDRTYEICEEYKNNYSNIKFISIINSGVSAARNKGLKIATGKYVLFLDSDDFLTSNALEEIERECTYNRDLIIFDFSEVDESGKTIKHFNISSNNGHYTKEYIQKEIISGYKMNSVCNKAFKRAIISEYNISFDNTIHHGEDLLFVMGYLTFTQHIYYINKSLYCYRKNALSATHIFNPRKNSGFFVNERMYDFLRLWKCDSNENISILNIRSSNVIYDSIVTAFTSTNVYNESIFFYIKKLGEEPFVKRILNNINHKSFDYKKRFVFYMMKNNHIISLFVTLKIYNLIYKQFSSVKK